MIAGMVLGGLGGWGSVISIGLQTSVYGFGRELEQEADDRAAAVLRASRYDPHALPEVFDILGHDYEGLDPRTPTIWSTHPEIRARAQTSRTLVAAMPHRERHVDAFEAAVVEMRSMTIQDYVQDDYPHTAVALAESLVERYPNDPRVLHLLGDAWQGMGARGRSTRRNSRIRTSGRTGATAFAERARSASPSCCSPRKDAPRTRPICMRAEDTYRRVLALDPGFAAAHRGLGEVYEQQERARDAAEAYLTYVKSSPDAADRPIVMSRLRALTAKLKGEQP